MACGDDAVQVEFPGSGHLAEVFGAVSDIIECARPPAAGIPHPSIFQAPRCESGLGKSGAKMPNVVQAVSGPPVTAVDHDGDRMRPRALRDAQFAKLKFAGPISDLVAGR